MTVNSFAGLWGVARTPLLAAIVTQRRAQEHARHELRALASLVGEDEVQLAEAWAAKRGNDGSIEARDHILAGRAPWDEARPDLRMRKS